MDFGRIFDLHIIIEMVILNELDYFLSMVEHQDAHRYLSHKSIWNILVKLKHLDKTE